MNYIFFPSQYKKALLKRTKNITIRIGDEIGQYHVGKIYSAKSYSGRVWNVKIKVINIFLTRLNQLTRFGIPQRSIESIQSKENISLNTKVELIKFKVL